MKTGFNAKREAREESEEYTKNFAELITFGQNKFLKAISDQLLFALRYLRELLLGCEKWAIGWAKAPSHVQNSNK